jgi:Ca2+-transporting ATPase
MNLATILSFSLLFVVMFIPALRDIFNVSRFSANDLEIVAVLAILPLIFGELTKVAKRLAA